MTSETTLKEFKFDDSNMAELVRNNHYSDYVVRYLSARSFSHKTFKDLKKAEKFYQETIDNFK